MKTKSKEIILSLLRRDFDAQNYRSACVDIIDTAIDVAGEDHPVVVGMVSDFAIDYREPYKLRT